MKPESEPQVIPFSASGGSDWSSIVSFMRDNPKLLMQMIPSSPERPLPKETPSEAAIKKTRINAKLKEAQQWKLE